MNFQGLTKIETVDFYIDVAIKRSKKAADEAKNSYSSKASRLEKSKIVELEKISIIAKTLITFFDGIIKAYPDIDGLPEFYKQMVSINLDMEALKKSLGGVNWSRSQLRVLLQDYNKRIKRTQDLHMINSLRREFLGRASSVVKQIKGELKYLEHARIVMKRFPTIKTGMKTIAIAGFPNVGKSTLLSRLTGSRPEVNNYAFTTKNLMIGYLKKSYNQIQMIDTPGTLNRLEKMNNVEVQAYYAMRYAADEIIFVFDLTETYPIKDQIKLYKNILKYNKETFVYLSKTDILDKKLVDDFKREHPSFKFMTFEDIKDMKGLI